MGQSLGKKLPFGAMQERDKGRKEKDHQDLASCEDTHVYGGFVFH